MVRDLGGEPLSAADASNVYIDAADQVNVFLLAGVLGTGGFVGSGGELELDQLRAALAARFRDDGQTELRRFSQRICDHGGRLTWLPSPPDLGRHVRQVAPVTGREGLAALCASLMTVPLPRDRPLWELLVVPGASPHGPGIVLRTHHAVADGAAGVGLVQRLFGDGSVDEHEPRAVERSSAAAPLPATAAPTGGPRRWRTLVTAVRRMTAVLRGAVPPTALLGPITPEREVAFTSVDLAAVHHRAHAAGATVNDALLSAVAVAAEAGLRAAGETVLPSLPASVPVALPDRRGSGNAVGVMMVPLPTGEPDGGRRLAQVARATRSRRTEARAQGTFELTRSRWGSRAFAWLARRQRFVALFVTNVRGPDRTLHVAGAPLLEAWPVAQLQGNVRLGVAAMSYAGRLCCTVHVASGALPADLTAGALGQELRSLAGEDAPGG